MRAREFITETTTAGAIATVALPLGSVQRRTLEDLSKINEGWRETLAALAAAGVMAFSGDASAAGSAQDNPNKITATITIDGDTKIMDLTNKNFRDVREASRWLENFLDQRGIDNWGARIERGKQGSGVYQRANISSAGADLGAGRR